VEVEMLEKQYADPSCDVQMRMQFMAENRSSRIVQALRRDLNAADDVRTCNDMFCTVGECT
jgi:hypothetical protein